MNSKVRFTLTLETDPPIDEGLNVRWSSSGNQLYSLGAGRFSAGPSTETTEVIVTAALGTIEYTRVFVLELRLATLNLQCAEPGCETIAPGNSTRLRVTGTDSTGLPVSAIWRTIERNGSITSRNPRVIASLYDPRGDVHTFRATTSGTSWIVVTADGLADSLLLTAQAGAP